MFTFARADRLGSETVRGLTGRPAAPRGSVTAPLGSDDEAAGWLAPETIVAEAVLVENRIASGVARERARRTFVPAATGPAMSIFAVVATAAILLALVA